MKKTLFFGAILIFFLLLTNAVYACSCRIQTPEQHFRNSSVVFVGEFQKSTLNAPNINATFKILRPLKGVTEASILVAVRTNYLAPMCGIAQWINERHGELWVIYANSSPKDMLLATTSCGGTSPIKR